MVDNKKLFEVRGPGNKQITQTSSRNCSTDLSNEGEIIKNILCDAVSCYAKATEKISISAGKFGKIDLFVCDKCIEIFKGKSKVDR